MQPDSRLRAPEKHSGETLLERIAGDPSNPAPLAAIGGLPAGERDDRLLRAAERLPLLDPTFETLTTAPLPCRVLGTRFQVSALENDQLANRLRRNEIYERHLSLYLHACLRPGDVFFDVGANIGYHSILAALLVGPAGRVVAFEPHPGVRGVLGRNVELNRLTNVTTDPRAVAQASGTAQIRLGALDSGTTSVADTPLASWRTHQVAVIPIDQACSDHGVRPIVVKIDVEGLEPEVLAGGQRLFTRSGPLVIMEFCPANWHRSSVTMRAALTDLERAGYFAHIFKGHDAAAIEPVPIPMLLDLADHWNDVGHAGFVDILLAPRRWVLRR